MSHSSQHNSEAEVCYLRSYHVYFTVVYLLVYCDTLRGIELTAVDKGRVSIPVHLECSGTVSGLKRGAKTGVLKLVPLFRSAGG